MECPFCDITKVEKRVFFIGKEWYAFLAAPFHAPGHTILAARINICPTRTDYCPRSFHEVPWQSLGEQLKRVSECLTSYYKSDDILYSSVRGDIKHFHFHLIPFWNDDANEWRLKMGYGEKGHLLEYIGNLEREGDKFANQECKLYKISKEKQREEIEKRLSGDVEELREIMEYSP